MSTHISIILRDNKYIIPSGATEIMNNDRLFVLSENKDSLNQVFECLEIDEKATLDST